MPFQIITGDYSASKWYSFLGSAATDTEESLYKALGIFSQDTNWEKIFVLGDKINKELKTTEQEVIDDIATFRKNKQ